ncbi:hypothetical protein ACJMK2_039076 [Sinanodonta woodiana]|uniref:SURF1-like protein n=1 Tax=Sinanodonta woodiana TaxID=1069815 RepID=A0ABD3WCU1_SINWO
MSLSSCRSALYQNILNRTKKLGNLLSLFRKGQTDASNKTFQSADGSSTLQTPRLKPVFRRNSDTGYALLVVPITSSALGVWQIYRWVWKKGLIKEMEDKMKREPIPLPSSVEEINNMEYVSVRVRGTFDHLKEMYIVPRSNVHPPSTSNPLEMNRQTGSYVVTPFKLSDRDWTILVNRGWVPPSRRNPVTRLKGQVNGEVELVGVIRKNEKRALFFSEVRDNSFPDSYRYRDIDTLASSAGTELVFIDADYASTVVGGPIGGQTRMHFRDQHVSYAMTWFALAGVTWILWKQRYRRPPRSHMSNILLTKK